MILSSGLKHGHPTLGTHANCSKLNLATVKKHFVDWGFKKSKEGQIYELHESQRAIFSTFDSGSLVAKFKLGKPITIECTRFNITYTDLSIANQNIAAISPTKVDNKRALDDELEAVNSITPSKKQKSNVIAMPASPVDNRVKTSKRKLFTD